MIWWSMSGKILPNIGRIIKMYIKHESLDTANSIPIVANLQHLESHDVNIEHFAHFIRRCYNKHALQVYDHPGDPRVGGFYHREGKSIKSWDKEVADYAFKWYQNNYPNGSRVLLKEVTKISCTPVCYPIYYVTFMVFDKRTNKETTLQAMVFEYGLAVRMRLWQLGLLRDASHDRVLAAVQLKQAPAGANADILCRVLQKVQEKVLVKT